MTYPACSIKDHRNKFLENVVTSQQNPLVVYGSDPESDGLALALYRTCTEMTERCKSHPSGRDCSFSGYVGVTVSDKEVNRIVSEVAKDTILSIPKTEVAAGAGCLFGGGIGLAAGSFEGGVGAVPGAVFGCVYGASVGEGLYKAYELVTSVDAARDLIRNVKRVLGEHSRACGTSSPIVSKRAQKSGQGSLVTSVDARRELTKNVSRVVGEHSRACGTSSPLVPKRAQKSDLGPIGNEICSRVAAVSGVKPLIDEVKSIDRLVRAVWNDPAKAPLKIASHLVKDPEAMVKGAMNTPNTLAAAAKELMSGSVDAFLSGAFKIVGIVLAVLQAATWLAQLAQNPKKTVIATLRMPVDLVMNAVTLSKMLIKNPPDAVVWVAEAVLKMPERTVKNFAISFGLKKKKRKRSYARVPETSPVVILQLWEQYQRGLISLYAAAKDRWIVDPYKNLEQFHLDLMQSWEVWVGKELLGNQFALFPDYLRMLLESGNMTCLHFAAPTAFLPEGAVPPEVAYEVAHLILDTANTISAVDAVNRKIEAMDRILVPTSLAMAALSKECSGFQEEMASFRSATKETRRLLSALQLKLGH